MDLLERRIQDALLLVVQAIDLQEQGTANAWEVARLYEKAAKLLWVGHVACQERARGYWSWRVERNGEGRVVRLWVGSQGEVREEPGGELPY